MCCVLIHYFTILYNTTGWLLSKLIYRVKKSAGFGQPEATAKDVNILRLSEEQTMTGVKLSQKAIHNTIIITANTEVVNTFSKSPMVRSMDDVD
jgi:hypothetical protein